MCVNLNIACDSFDTTAALFAVAVAVAACDDDDADSNYVTLLSGVAVA